MRTRRAFLFKDVPGALVSAADWSNFARGSIAVPALGSMAVAPVDQLYSVDAARFARVVTSDPARMDGARAGRTEEFRAEDLFLETDIQPTTNGTYLVPVASNTSGCIGLIWPERRLINAMELEFVRRDRMPAIEGVRVQAWVGGMINEWGNHEINGTLWQGHWVPLLGPIERQGERWRFRVDLKDISDTRGAVQKIRWIFPPSSEQIELRRICAFTDDVWQTTELRMELEQPLAGKRAEMEIYNGAAQDPPASSKLSWDLSTPLRLKILSIKKSPPPGSVRSLLMFKFETGAYAVSVDDVLNHQYVYVPEAKLLVTSGSASASLAEYRNQIAGKKTILERVREMPDQTLSQAMEKAHHAIQDSGPMLLSLACDNPKFILEPDQTVLLASKSSISAGLVAKFGSADSRKTATHLHGEWMPVPVVTKQEGGVIYRQTTFVIPYDKDGPPLPLKWLNRRPLGIVEYDIENRSPQATGVSLQLSITSDWKYLGYGLAKQRSDWLAQRRPRLSMQHVTEGAVVNQENRLLAFLDAGSASPLHPTIEENVLYLKGTLPSGGRVRCWAYLPRWDMGSQEYLSLRGGENLLDEAESYWKSILGSGTQIELPDPALMNIIRASQVHGLISSRNELDGGRIEQWGASLTYRGLNALFYLIPAMDLLGQHDFARRALEYYVSRYTPEGLLSDGYTLAGLGWHLQLLWDHYALTRDIDWLRDVSPQIEHACWWIIRQKEKTKKFDPQGNKVPEYGLAPPGVTADWSAYNYYFCLNAYFHDGLQSGIRALEEIGYEDSRALRAYLKDYHEEILRAYHWEQARMPVNRLRNGTWVPPYPSQVPLPGTMGLFFPSEDDGRPGLGCFDVELGAHNMVPLGVLDPSSQEVRSMVEHMEDYWFLAEGWHDYPASESEKDWFNLGGFSKVQPNLCRVAEIYAMMDEVKPFVRSYFNFIAPQINKHNLTFWEDFTPNSGAWGSMEGSGYLLLLTRIMLVMERGDELWLAPFVTNNWLKEGMSVRVKDAPTHFGSLSYRIHSFVSSGFIEAEIDPPRRTPPKRIVIRLRHPEGKRIKAVVVGGVPHTDFDPLKEVIRLQPSNATLHVKAEY